MRQRRLLLLLDGRRGDLDRREEAHAGGKPNLVVANNPSEAGFLGDYMWVSTDTKGNGLIVWADTRGLGGAVEEDIYFAKRNE